MIGTTLTDIRDHIESLASDDGEYYLVCARYGDRPVPASDLRFDTRATARAAAQATAQYRQALRRYDPQVPYYDIVVCQAVDIQTRCARIERLGCDSQSTCPAPLAEPVVNRSPSVARELVEFCHYVAAAVFETLSERDGRLPVLPLTLELCRHYTERPVQSVQMTAVDGGWQLTLGLADMADQNGLVSVPIDGEV